MNPVRHRPGLHLVARGGAGELERAIRWLRLCAARRARLRAWKLGRDQALTALRERRHRP